MFEDFSGKDGFDLDWDHASDREVLHAIWTRLEVGDLDAVDGWAALWERYPDDLRFLFFLTHEQWSHAQVDPEAFLRQIERLGSDPKLREPVTDLLSMARHAERGALHKDFERIAGKFDGARRDDGEARTRLQKLERRVLEELHDRTLGNRPLRPARKPSEMRAEDWATMVERAKNEPELPFSTTTRFKVGAKLKHPTLGIGFVTARREGKIDVIFQSGRRTLVGK